MRGKSLISVFLLFFLVACGKDEPVPQPPPVNYLHYKQLSYVYDGHEITGISPVSAFEESADGLLIFPYFDGNDYILIERIYLSGNKFWDTVSSEYEGTPNKITENGFSLFTTGRGVSIGCVPINEEEGYIVRTETLSSAYVQKVCEILCQ